MAAVRNNKIEVVKYLLAWSYYVPNDISYDIIVKSIRSGDQLGNTFLHYAYDYDLTEIRSLLKENGLFFTRMRNNKGMIPRQMLHDDYFESSAEEDPNMEDSYLDVSDEQLHVE